MAAPLIGYFVYPAFVRHEKTWKSVGNIDDLPVGIPKALDYSETVKDGWMETKAVKAVWALKHPNNEITVYSPICPHLQIPRTMPDRSRQNPGFRRGGYLSTIWNPPRWWRSGIVLGI